MFNQRSLFKIAAVVAASCRQQTTSVAIAPFPGFAYTTKKAVVAKSRFNKVKKIHRSLTTSRSNITTMASTPNDEVSKAILAAASITDDAPATIFDKIVAGDIPCNKVYEDEFSLAFRDINPQAPVHCLVIPKQRNGLTQLSKAQECQKELLGHLMYVASQIGKQECPNGFRLVVNDGVDAAQSVYHLHIHVLGGRQMGWPPG